MLIQTLLPKLVLTRLLGLAAAWRGGVLTRALTAWFVRRYGVQMNEAAQPDLAAYASFNDFFTRALKPGARPLASADLVCPVDGSISQFGAINAGQLVQAKGHSYSVQALLAGDAELAAQFNDGHFATLYLSPKDYHRIHMPCAARLERMVHVPGDLYSVNPETASRLPGLFARNERLVCVFDARAPRGAGRFVLVMVGATVVGSMATTWHGVVNPPRPGYLREWRYADREIVFKQGDEMGRFLLGSTVVLLFPKSPLRFNPGWAPAVPIRMGERMADLG